MVLVSPSPAGLPFDVIDELLVLLRLLTVVVVDEEDRLVRLSHDLVVLVILEGTEGRQGEDIQQNLCTIYQYIDGLTCCQIGLAKLQIFELSCCPFESMRKCQRKRNLNLEAEEKEQHMLNKKIYVIINAEDNLMQCKKY